MSDPVALVDGYLQRCEDRAIDEAAAALSPAFRMQFPGGVEFRSLAELVAAPQGYAWVRKHRDRYAVGTDGSRTVVTSIGRLYGELLDGTPFENIRYADVFVLADGLIAEQIVWNDLSEAGIHPPAHSTSPADTDASDLHATSRPRPHESRKP